MHALTFDKKHQNTFFVLFNDKLILLFIQLILQKQKIPYDAKFIRYNARTFQSHQFQNE